MASHSFSTNSRGSWLNCWILLILSCIFAAKCTGHALLSVPNQRGSLATTTNVKGIDENAPKDYWAHFPAGDKDDEPGAGARSQIREAGSKGWAPFRPLDKGFKWRAGVCGDRKGPKQDHRRGGRYYYGGKIVRTYTQGGILAAQVNVVANHGGFFEFHICDVSKCGGEISEECFRGGHCKQLQRAPNPKCDDGRNSLCAPIDPKYPGRWYMPCSNVHKHTSHGLSDYFGGDTMLYRLPEKFVCEHCVLQWFWSTGNSCNAPGVIEYFDGEQAPKWGTCKGQAGAIGGVSRVQPPCGPHRFPEEYLQCADIRIDRSKTDDTETSEPQPSSQSIEEPTASSGPIIGHTVPTNSIEEQNSDQPESSVKPAKIESPEPTAEYNGFQELVTSQGSSEVSSYHQRPTVPYPKPQLQIPEGYLPGIYPPKTPKATPEPKRKEWASYIWAPAERARRQNGRNANELATSGPSMHHWDEFNWAREERKRRGHEKHIMDVDKTKTNLVATPLPLQSLPERKASEGIKHLLVTDSIAWARAERIRRQQVVEKDGEILE